MPGVYTISALTWNNQVLYLVKKGNSPIYMFYKAKQFNYRVTVWYYLCLSNNNYYFGYYSPWWTKRQLIIIVTNDYLRVIVCQKYPDVWIRTPQSPKHRHLLPQNMYNGISSRRDRNFLQIARCRSAHCKNSSLPW